MAKAGYYASAPPALIGEYKTALYLVWPSPRQANYPSRHITLLCEAMLISTLFVQALLAAGAIALPSSRERFERRVAMHKSKMLQSSSHATSATNATNSADDQYNDTWAGGIISSSAVRIVFVDNTLRDS